MENNIILKMAEEDDSKEIYLLMKRVYNDLEDKALYVCDDLEYVKEHIKGKGFSVIALDKGKIVGSFIFSYPGMDADNLGRDIGLCDEELLKVVHMESAVVEREYRGQKLQMKMLEYGENLIDKGKYKYFMATVSPFNPASFKSLENRGYTLMDTKEKYGGLTRRIYLKRA